MMMIWKMNLKKPSKIAVIGLGKAGLARLKATLQYPTLEIIATCSRRGSLLDQIDSLSPYFNEPQIEHIKYIPNLSLPQLFALDHLDTVMICSENQYHFEQAKQALSLGLHTIVDFPPCYTHDQLKTLYQLAQEHQCIFQPAFIGQLSTPFQNWKKQLSTQAIEKIILHLSGGYYRWLEIDGKQGLFANLALSRFLSLWTIIGPIDENYQLHAELLTDGYQFSIEGQSISGIQFSLSEERKVGLSRHVQTWAQLKDGKDLRQEKGLMEPLFEYDLLEFLKSFDTDQKSMYQEPTFQHQLLEVMAFCEKLDREIKSLLKSY